MSGEARRAAINFFVQLEDRRMTPLDRCFQVLSVLIKADDANGLDLMKQAIDEYRDAEQMRGVSALADLRELILNREPATNLREHAIAYIDKKSRRITLG